MRLSTIALLSLIIVSISLLGCEKKTAPPVTREAASIHTEDGLRLAYETRGAGPTTLLFIHGWSCNRIFWGPQLSDLADDYHIFALDLPGHGESDKQREEWSVEALGADVVAAIQQADLQRVILVGHSMGGPVALVAAALAPDRVIGVIGVDTLHNVEFRWPEAMADQFLLQFEQNFEATTQMMVNSMLPPATEDSLRQWIISQMQRADPSTAIALFRSLVSFDQAAALAAVSVPVRCINAAPRTDMGMPTAVETNSSYADFDVVLMEGVGHFPMLETPEEFNSHLRAVADSLSAG